MKEKYTPPVPPRRGDLLTKEQQDQAKALADMIRKASKQLIDENTPKSS